MLKSAAAFVFSVAVSTAAFACSCMPMDRSQMIAQSDAAFRGKVLSVRRTGDVNMGQVDARVRIIQAFKGVRRGRIVRVRTGANSAMCGIELQPGETIAVGASRIGRNAFSTGLCSILPN